MPTKSTASQIVKIFVQKVLAKVSQPGKKKKKMKTIPILAMTRQSNM